MSLATVVAEPSTIDVRLDEFTIYGYKSNAEGRAAEIHELVTGADLTRTIDGAPTLTVTAIDPDRFLVGMQLLSYRVMFTLDTYAFELAQIKKSGDQFTMTFEDVRVAEMRRANRHRKIPANTMSRVEFAYLLLTDLPPTNFVTPPIPLDVSKVELARGKEKLTAGATPEDTWKALTRIFGDIRWRFWVDGGQVFAAPDTYLASLPPAAHLSEYTGPVQDIGCDLDAGKKVQKATITVQAERWTLPIGAVVVIDRPTTLAGNWIVSEIKRSLFDQLATVTVVQPVFPLPEPTQPATSAGGTTTATAPATEAAGAASAVTPKGTFQAYAAQQASAVYAWGADEFAAIDEIWTAESGWRPDAQNPTSTAYGIAQFLDSTWETVGATKTSDGYKQIDAGLAYIAQRYGTPLQALAFRKRMGWY